MSLLSAANVQSCTVGSPIYGTLRRNGELVHYFRASDLDSSLSLPNGRLP